MRVLYVINGFDPGGAEHGLLTLIETGFFESCELHVFAICRGASSLAEKVRQAVGPNRFQLTANTEALTFADMIRAVPELFRVMKDARPELVVLSLKQANLLGRGVLALFPGTECVSFEHIARHTPLKTELLYAPLLLLSSWRVDRVWADCRETLTATRRYFLPRRRAKTVVPLFCVRSDLPAKQSYRIDKSIRIACAGRLIERKNFLLVIEMLAKMRAERHDFNLDIYGEGPQRTELVERAAALGLAAYISFHGYTPAWFEQALEADIFVNMSSMEGFCIVVAEAMSVGLPVIATNVGGIAEYGSDDVNMLKLEQPDEAGLANRIARLAVDEALRRRIGQRARADMFAQFSAEALRQRGRDVLSHSAG